MSHYYRSNRQQRTFTSRQDRNWRRNQNTVTFTPTAALGPISHTVLVALMIAVLGMIYLMQVTKTSTFSYDINDRQEKLSALKLEKEDLANENARLQALKNVAGSDVAKAMTAPASTEYARN